MPDKENPTSSDLWVGTEVHDGGYVTTITVGKDQAWTLDEGQTEQYAMACIARAAEAEHDAAVWALCRNRVKLEPAAIKQLVNDTREARGLDHGATEPLRFVPGVSAYTGKPFLAIQLGQKTIGQLDPQQLYRHAMGALTTLATVKLDNALVQTLTTTIGASEDEARVMISDLVEHWPT